MSLPAECRVGVPKTYQPERPHGAEVAFFTLDEEGGRAQIQGCVIFFGGAYYDEVGGTAYLDPILHTTWRRDAGGTLNYTDKCYLS